MVWNWISYFICRFIFASSCSGTIIKVIQYLLLWALLYILTDFFGFPFGRYKWCTFSKKFNWILSPLLYQPSIAFWVLIYLFKLYGFMYLFIAKKCLFILPVCMCSVFNEKGLIKLMPEIHVCIFRAVFQQVIWLSSPVLSEANRPQFTLKYSYSKTLECASCRLWLGEALRPWPQRETLHFDSKSQSS